jgi:hypothetical protein
MARMKFMKSQQQLMSKWPKAKYAAYMADILKLSMKYKSQLLRGKIPAGFKKEGAARRRKYGLKTPPKNLM